MPVIRTSTKHVNSRDSLVIIYGNKALVISCAQSTSKLSKPTVSRVVLTFNMYELSKFNLDTNVQRMALWYRTLILTAEELSISHFIPKMSVTPNRKCTIPVDDTSGYLGPGNQEGVYRPNNQAQFHLLKKKITAVPRQILKFLSWL